MPINRLRYRLEDDVPFKENVVFSAQHIVFFIASTVVMPIIVGYALGLAPTEVADLLQRTLFLCGLVSLLQTALGHRFPIIDAPAGLWAGLLLLMSANIETFGNDYALLRTNLETGMIMAGGVIVILTFSGLIRQILKLFTPIVNGVLILLMVLQLAPSVVKGMTGIDSQNAYVDGPTVIVFFVTIVAILLINAYARGFVQSIATFIGVIIGWLFAALIGVAKSVGDYGDQIFSIPELFAWGQPTFDPGISITCIMAALLLLSMVFASVNGTADAVDEDVSPKRMNKTVGVHGVATILTGLFATIGFMPYVSSAGIVRMTNVASRKPFYWAAAGMMILGLITPLATFFATIPTPVGYAALIMIFALIMGQGLREFKKITIGNRESFIVGISILTGMGVMFLPASAFSKLPQVLSYLLSNGLVDGMLIAIILEKIVLREKQRNRLKSGHPKSSERLNRCCERG